MPLTRNNNLNGNTNTVFLPNTATSGNLGVAGNANIDGNLNTNGNVSMTGNLSVIGNMLYHATTNQQTGLSYALALSDDGKIIEMNNASANSLVIPSHNSAPYPIGTQITIIQTGAGQTTVSGSAEVTINAGVQSVANTAKLRAQWSSVVLLKRSSNVWLVMGDLA
jgi:hypothetical protein